MNKNIISIITLIVFIFPLIGIPVANAENIDYAVYIYNDFIVDGGQTIVSGNAIACGNVNGLNSDDRIVDGMLYADKSKIDRFYEQWGPGDKISEYLAPTDYTGDAPNIGLKLKDFPVLADKGSSVVDSTVNIKESGWYKNLNITQDGETDFTITSNAGQTIELRIDNFLLYNSVTVVGGGNVILYVDNMTSGGVPTLNLDGNSNNFALYFSDNKNNTLTNLYGNFNTYTNNSTITFTGDTLINGNVFSNGTLNMDAAIINGFVGGENLQANLYDTAKNKKNKIVPNIKGQLVAKNVLFSRGPLVEYGDVGNIKGGITEMLQESTPSPTSSVEPSIPPSGDYEQGILGDYYDIAEFVNESALRMKRIDDRPRFDWAYGSPDEVIEPETYSVRWTGYIRPERTATYTFKTLSDDGVMLKIKDKTLINHWGLIDLEYTTATEPITLEAGVYYPIVMEYQQLPIHSLVYLFWETENGMELVPKTVFFVDKNIKEEYATPQYFNVLSKSGNGLSNSFYNYDENGNVEATPVFTEHGAVDYDWGTDAPYGVTADSFFGVMEGSIEAKYTERLGLSFVVDDAVRVYVDNNLIIDEWKPHSQESVIGYFNAVAGKKHTIRIEYADFGIGATCIMRWFSDLQPLETVPIEFLYH